MKTILEIKDEVAAELGPRYNSYGEEMKSKKFDTLFAGMSRYHHIIDAIAKRYAEEALKEAAEMAKVQITGNETFLASISEGNNSVNPDDLSNCTLSVSKESILSLINELK